MANELIPLLVLLAVGSVQAATLSWDQPGELPEMGWRIYLDGAEVSDVTTRQADVTLPVTGGTYTVRAYLGETLSAPSEPLVIPAAPSGIKIQIEF